ncbi:hypothetical protein Pmani_021420 [Petrolisthes manimaculis]|uniref:Ig-like domain-containing protein n=1 Tax=Petrolisthes manimaculis TaxID=1843537 RepID=A0AAE1PGG2_9EUCA|nr:hypothetical protein Pmani_021420 [Petrolisthes manimaculis]
MPVVKKHTKEESHVSSSSTTSFHKSTVVESSSFTQVVSSDGGGGESRHSASTASSSQVQVASGQPVVEVHATRQQEVRQEGAAPPMITDKVSLIKKEGEKITQEISQDSSTAPLSPPIKKITSAKKKLSPARFMTPMQGVITKEDSQVVLECVIDGHPEPVVSWTHNGGPLRGDAEVKTNLNKTTLTIPRVNQNHAGHYTCFIENDAGSAQCTCDVIVKKTQFPPVISKRLQPAIVGVNERLHLEIDVTGTPTPTVKWTKDGQPLTASDHITLKSEGTRQILVISQAEPGDSGRYGVIASNSAGRAESLADVMVTQLILDKAPPTHKVMFTDITDEARRNIESIEEGHVKSIKRAIEEVAVEAPPIPVKILKFPPPQPPSEPTPPEAQPEIVRPEEQEVRPTPGKLKKMWPPPPSEMEVAPKIDASVEMLSCNVSSIISSFSALGEEEEAYTSHHAPVVHQSKPQHLPQVSEVMDIDLQPEPIPEYGYLSSGVPEEEQHQEEPETLQQVLLPGPEPELVLVEPPEPEEETVEENSEWEMMQGYQRVSAPITALHKILSPVPEVEPEPVPTPEPPRILTPEPPKEPTPEPPKEPTPEPPREPTPEPPKEPTPEPPKEPTPEPPQALMTTIEVAQEPPEPTTTTEVRTETSTVESSFFESKKSMSKTSYSTVETQMYTTGISSPPLEQPSAPVIPEPVEEPQPVLEVMETEPVESYEHPVCEEPIEYFVPESEEMVEYVTAEESAPEMISEAEELAFTESSLSSMKSEMQTIFVATSDLKTNVYTPEPEEPPVPQFQRPLLEPLIMPEPQPIEQLYVVEEAVKPPKPPEVKEQKKPKKKRESVIQLAKRLEETIVPMSPDEVPGGIRMFPSPKQPSTPVKESPAPTRETRSTCVTPTPEVKDTKLLDLEPFPFTVEEKPRRDRPKSLPPPWPSKFTPGTFTDSEYESDIDGERHIHIKKIKFEVPAKAPRPHSVATDAAPPSVFDTPPVFEGGMRPDILKKEEIVEKEEPKKMKTIAPKKKAKVVEKFLASAGEKAEIEVVKPVPRTPVKREAAPSWPPPADESHFEGQQTGGVYKETTSMTSSMETKSQVTSMSYQSHVSKVTQETKQFSAPPHEVVLEPEPAPVYVLQPEPEPVYVQQPEPVYEPPTEPEPVCEPPAEPAPVYELQLEPEPVYVQQPEPEPVCDLQPEPAPVYEIQPQPVPVPVVDAAPKFKPVRAPAPKQTPVKPAPAPAPPPPFDVPPPVFKPVVKPEVVPVQVPQKPASTKIEKQVSSENIHSIKKSETSSVSVQKSQKVLKKGNVIWPPSAPETPSPSVQFRSQSAERPKVSEASTLPQRPHEAPASIYWYSNITLQEKRKSWPQVMPEQPQLTTSTVIESSTKSSRQEISKISKQSSETQVVKEMTTQVPRQPVQEMIMKVPTPRPQFQVKAPKIEPKKEVVIQAPPPPIEFPTIKSTLPPLEPFPFDVGPIKPKKSRGQAPNMPSKFIPGSFTESEYESDYDSMSSSLSRMYMSDSEATGYRPMNIKMKKGRSKKPKQPSPPPPSSLGLPPAFEVKLSPLKVSFSDIESDIPTSRESTPLPEHTLIQSKQKLQVHKLQTLASEITPGSKPQPQHFIPQKPQAPVKMPAPIVPVKPAQPVQQPPKPVQQPAPPTVARSTFTSTEENVQRSVQQVTSETVAPVVGVKNVKKMFEGGGPPPMPQVVAAPIRMQSPSPVRAAAFLPSVQPSPIQAPVPPQTVIPPQPVTTEPPTRVIPVAVETNAIVKTEQVSSTNHVKGKPTSPKAKKKMEMTQMTAQEMEESGYTADTEGTLPRRTAKTANTQSSSNFTSSSSYSKSETFMSSSFSKSENKSFSSSQFDQGMPSSFPVSSSFPAGGGLPPEGSFPSSFPSFPSTPASTLGQTSHFSSSFKSSESKASQVFTSRSEEVHEESRGSAEQPKTQKPSQPKQEAKKPRFEEKKPKFEEFKKETKGKAGSSGPFSEDTYYSMRDESDVSTDSGRTKKKVEFQSETHVEVMSDKKVEIFESSSVDVSPKPTKKPAPKQEQKLERKVIVEPKIERPHQITKTFQSVKETPKPSSSHEIRTQKSTVTSEMSEKKEHAAKTMIVKKTVETSKVDGIKKPQQFSEAKVIKPTTKEKWVKETVLKPQPSVPHVQPLKSTGLVKQAVTKQESKSELDLKPFPFKAEPSKPKKPRGEPPPQPSKFKKGEFHESDYDSDFEGRIPPKWKPGDSDTEDQSYGSVSAPAGVHMGPQRHQRTPTPPTAFDVPPQYEGPPRPKIDFPESEPEPDRETSPEFVIPEKIEVVQAPVPPRIIPKEAKIFKSQPQKPKPPPARSPSPELKPGSPPVEDYAPPPPKKPQQQPPPPQPSPFANAVGVESTKITKIADSSSHHQRFVTMQQTTRVIKFTDGRTTSTGTATQETQVHEPRGRKVVREETKPLPPLEPFPFTPDPLKPKKDRGGPPPKPKKFRKGEFTESDYESDYEGPPRPKWQPPDSDTDDPSYKKIMPGLRSDRTPSKTRDRTPTPPTQFDTPPESGGPWRPDIKQLEPIVLREPSPEVIAPREPPKKIRVVKKVAPKVQQEVMKPVERPASPPLPPPGTPPEEGVIMEETQYVVDRVDLQSRVKPLPVREVQTYEDKPYTKVTERTEKTITNIKLKEELRMKREKKETKKTIVTEYEEVPVQPSLPLQIKIDMSLEKYKDLEPFPFEPGKEKPRREKGPPPPKPKKFVKGEFQESDYDSDFEGRVRPKWQPSISDAEDPEYTPVRPPPPSCKQAARSRERTPTPPTKFEVPPSSGGPLRPDIEPVEKPVKVIKEPSPEIVIPKVKEKHVTKAVKTTPKAPALKVAKPQAPRPRTPTPPLPEPGPQPEIGYIPETVKRTVEEDVHIKMIKKKIEAKKGFQIDIDVTDIYDFVSESEHEKMDVEISKTTNPFPVLEPFPYEPDPGRPKRQRGPPPPHPKKFMKGEFRGSDYESDYDAPIAPKWVPPDSEGEERVYRRVAPPAIDSIRHRSESSGRDPSPPSKFDQPPHFEGPPRPVIDPSDLPRRERRESLEEYSIPRFPKVEFKPFDLEDEQVSRPQVAVTTDTETEPESYANAGIDKKYVKSAQKVVGHQFEDMTQTFRHKAQRFAEQLVTEVFAAREGSVPAEPAGEPPSMPDELKTQETSTEAVTEPPQDAATRDTLSDSLQEPQAYRDESRVSEFGTKHIDPDTGLIYFKYDFGYEFGVILPGEAKKVEKKREVNGDHSGDIPIPVLHETTTDSSSQKPDSKKIPKSNGYVPHLEGGQPKHQSGSVTQHDSTPSKGSSIYAPVSPHPSQQSDISETDREYQQYMGKMIPEFVPKKQAQFRPISGDPYSDSEVESDHPSPSKLSDPSAGVHVGPKRFVPVVPGAAVQPKSQPPQGPLPETPAELGVLGSPLSATPPSTPSTPCSGPLIQTARPLHYITPLRDLSVASGEVLKLECVVQADPSVQVTWSRGGEVLHPSPHYQMVYKNGVCRLIIPCVSPDDEGVYTCTAMSVMEMDSTSATVCITGEKA